MSTTTTIEAKRYDVAKFDWWRVQRRRALHHSGWVYEVWSSSVSNEVPVKTFRSEGEARAFAAAERLKEQSGCR